MVDAFFLEVPKDKPIKCFSRGSRQGENRRKRLYFQRAVEMKQPHTMTEPFIIKDNELEWRSISAHCFLKTRFIEGREYREGLNAARPVTQRTSEARL